MISVSVENKNQLDEVLKNQSVDKIIIGIENFSEDLIIDYFKLIIKHKKKPILLLETITKNEIFKKGYYKIINNDLIDTVIVQNINSFFYIIDNFNKKLEIIFNYNINIYNKFTKNFFINYLKNTNFTYKFVCPVELNIDELREIGFDIIVVYGYQPLMVSENCIYKNTNKCKKNQYDYIKDKLNNKFYFRSYCKFCYNKIFNTYPTDIRDVDIKKLNILEYRYDFTFENNEEIKKILNQTKNLKLRTKGHIINSIK